MANQTENFIRLTEIEMFRALKNISREKQREVLVSELLQYIPGETTKDERQRVKFH